MEGFGCAIHKLWVMVNCPSWQPPRWQKANQHHPCKTKKRLPYYLNVWITKIFRKAIRKGISVTPKLEGKMSGQCKAWSTVWFNSICWTREIKTSIPIWGDMPRSILVRPIILHDTHIATAHFIYIGAWAGDSKHEVKTVKWVNTCHFKLIAILSRMPKQPPVHF